MKSIFTRTQFFDTLFDDDEYICLADNANGVEVFSIEEARSDRHNAQFYSLNPLDGEKDNDPCEEYHSSDKPRRADVNCTRMSNILIEFDGESLSVQRERLISSGLWDLCAGVVYSGSKSLHAIISIHGTWKTKDAYSRFVSHFHKVVHLATGIAPDFSTKNPSRLTRCPMSIREKDNKCRKQFILHIGKRIDIRDLQSWMESHGFSGHPPKEDRKNKIHLPLDVSMETKQGNLTSRTLSFLSGEVGSGFVHNERYVAVCDMATSGMNFEEIVELCERAYGAPSKNAYKTMEDAYDRTVRERLSRLISNTGGIKIGKTYF